MEGKAAEKAAELSATNEGRIPVVCTPTSGAQSVRLNLDENWDEQLSEEQLLDAILKRRDNEYIMHWNVQQAENL